MEININMEIESRECECRNESVIRIRSEYAFDRLKVIKFIFYNYMHAGTEFGIKHVQNNFVVECRMERARVMPMHEITEKLKLLQSRCKYETRLMHLVQKKYNMHTQHSQWR